MSINEEEFFPGDEVGWKDDEELGEEDQKAISVLKIFYGGGPFTVVEAFVVPADQVERVRCRNLLRIKDSSGELVSPSDVTQHLSGFWFKRIRGARPN